MQGEVRLRILVVDPPRGVRFAVQRGKADLAPPTRSTATRIAFDLTVRVADGRADTLPNFLGPFAQGPPVGRFVYISSGTSAGQMDSCWTRRAKVPFAGISWAMIEEAMANDAAVIEARIGGTARDGGPACATVPLLDGGWRVVVD